MIDYTLVPCSLLIEEPQTEDFALLREQLIHGLANFTCKRSNSVSHFMHDKVLEIERHGEGRTYLFVTVTETGVVDIAGFFELCLSTIDFSKLSGKKRSQFRSPVAHLRDDHAGAYCIGELGRSDNYGRDELPGSVILNEAVSLIITSRDIVGGRYALIEARPEIFNSLYVQQGFKQVGVTSVEAEGDCEIHIGLAKITSWEMAKA